MPDVEAKEDFIITQTVETVTEERRADAAENAATSGTKARNRQKKNEKDEFDLSDIKAFNDKMTKEDIIAAAEAAAFAE